MAQVVTVYFATNRMPLTDAGGGTIVDFGPDLDPALSPEKVPREAPVGNPARAEIVCGACAPSGRDDVPNDRARSSRSR
jgi:hypothetical protein